jgi:hypothetical protein
VTPQAVGGVAGNGVDARKIIGDVVEIIRAAVYMLTPFIPTACDKVTKWTAGKKLGDIDVLFTRLELKRVMEIVGGKDVKK